MAEILQNTNWKSFQTKSRYRKLLNLSINVLLKKQWVFVSKTSSEWEHLFHNIRCPCWLTEHSKLSSYLLFNSPLTNSLYIQETRLGKGSFRIDVLTLVQNIMENRLRHARGPVHSYVESITLIQEIYFWKFNIWQQKQKNGFKLKKRTGLC